MKATNASQLEFVAVADGVEHAHTADSTNPGGAMIFPSDTVRDGFRPKAQTKERAVAPAMENLLTFVEAASLLGISLRQFRRLVDAGKVAFVKVSKRTPRVRPSELQRFLEASAVKYTEVQS